MSFRSSKYCERYEFVSNRLVDAIKQPGANQYQDKTGYTFIVSNTNDNKQLDWYNARIELSYKVTKYDNTNVTDAHEVATTNGGFSLFKRMTVKVDNVIVMDSSDINHAIQVKNILEFSKSYSDTIGQSMSFYPDTSTAADSAEFTADAATHTAKQNLSYNAGFAKRKAQILNGGVVSDYLPLNRYGFFDSLEDKILPFKEVDITLELEEDSNVIYGNATTNSDPPVVGDARRYLVTKMVLWVPKMSFKPEGEDIFLTLFLEKIKALRDKKKKFEWTYLRERVVYHTSQEREGVFKIASSIARPRHAFIWVINKSKIKNQLDNMFAYNTYDVAGNNVNFVECQLETENGTFYPLQAMRPTTELTKTYDTLMSYCSGNSNYIMNPIVDLKSFKKLYGLLYFTLTYQEEKIKYGTTKLEFNYTLSDTPDAQYVIYALVLCDQNISIDVVDNKAELKL